MKEIKLKELRRVMYARDKESKEQQLNEESLIVRSSQDTVLIESRGQRQYVPTVAAFSRLLTEHKTLKTNHNKAVKEINVLKEALKKIIRSVNDMEDELKRKVDLPDA